MIELYEFKLANGKMLLTTSFLKRVPINVKSPLTAQTGSAKNCSENFLDILISIWEQHIYKLGNIATMPRGRGWLPTAVHHICVQCNIVHNQSFPCYGKLLQTIIGYSSFFL